MLSLYDPTGFAPFVSERNDANVGPAINGGWQTITVNQNNLNDNINVNGTHAILCNGSGIAIYNITSRSQIIFTILRSRGCSKEQMSILTALDSTVFYRIRNNTYLYLYDYGLNNIFYAFYGSFVGYHQSLDNIGGDTSANQTTTQVQPAATIPSPQTNTNQSTQSTPPTQPAQNNGTAQPEQPKQQTSTSTAQATTNSTQTNQSA
jgi:hypothetical protein